MKLVTIDYGCGTSSSILDYGTSEVVVVSEDNYSHVFETEDDLLFIGHDFLFFLWDSEEKVKKWSSRKGKWQHWVWCFERIDSIVNQWMQKSHYSLSIANTFCTRILACDEDDCAKYGLDWLPQWASSKFYTLDSGVVDSKKTKILFSGQAGKPEYAARNEFLINIFEDKELREVVEVTNTDRDFSWESYITNMQSYPVILNPVGILRGLNTRAYEALYSGRVLLQHTYGGRYEKHEEMLRDNPGVIFFSDILDLKKKIKLIDSMKPDREKSFSDHSLYSRMKSIGAW